MLLEINFTLILFAISFLIFVFLINLTLYKPVGKVIEDRKSLIDGDFANAKKFTEGANQLLESYKKDIKSARLDAQNLIQAEIGKEQKVRLEKVQKLINSLNKEKDDALKKTNKEKDDALKKLRNESKALVDLITSKVLGKGEKELAKSR